MAVWLAAVATPAPAAAAIAVNPGGQATTSVAIAVPPGIAGLSPNLSLAYVDGGLNGPLGVGWSLQGISAITRCPSTRATDGFHRAVDFTSADRLCLDGQRLIRATAGGEAIGDPQDFSGVRSIDALAPGPAAADCREYRTEKDSFARIRACGSAGADPEDGPASVRVWTKAGLLQEYGTNPALNDARVHATLASATTGSVRRPVAVWAISRATDASGNHMDFRYVQRDVAWGSGVAPQGDPGHEWNIAEIAYTGNGNQQPHNKIVFEYQDRPASATGAHDRQEAYQRNHKNVGIARLAAIRSWINSPNVTAGPGRWRFRCAPSSSPTRRARRPGGVG